MSVIIGVFAGFLLGVLYKGEFNININKHEIKEQQVIEYNESLADELDPEIRNYYNNTNGLNKF